MDELKRSTAGYNRSDEDRPIVGYGALMAVYGVVFSGLVLLVKRSGHDLSEPVGLADLLLVGIATQRLSRLIAKDTVTSAARAPFTTFEGSAGGGEINESPRGRGVRHAIGELLTCPFCVGQWIATAFMFGLVLAPRISRFVAGLFTAISLADFMQLAYDAAKQGDETLERKRAEA